MFDSSTVMGQSGFCISSASKTFLRSATGFATERYLKFLSPRFSEHVAIFYYNKNCDRFCSQLRVFKGSDSCRNASPDVLTCHNYVFCPNHQEGQKLSLQIINATINTQYFVAQAILWLSLFGFGFFFVEQNSTYEVHLRLLVSIVNLVLESTAYTFNFPTSSTIWLIMAHQQIAYPTETRIKFLFKISPLIPLICFIPAFILEREAKRPKKETKICILIVWKIKHLCKIYPCY